MIEAVARRGPKKSHAVPVTSLAKAAPETDAIPALPMSVAVRLRLSRMIGRRGGAAKVETKQEKKEIHDRWKSRMWGAAADSIIKASALFSESTGRANLRCSDSDPEPEAFMFEFICGMHKGQKNEMNSD